MCVGLRNFTLAAAKFGHSSYNIFPQICKLRAKLLSKIRNIPFKNCKNCDFIEISTRNLGQIRINSQKENLWKFFEKSSSSFEEIFKYKFLSDFETKKILKVIVMIYIMWTSFNGPWNNFY